jgi:LysR family transcriptional regulator, hydrogen peroxide-inducible genes activator
LSFQIVFIHESYQSAMNLSQLRFVTALASKRSFTAAALECSVTQPTLSNGLAQLENELGAPLFVRTTREVDLTPFGENLLPYIAEVLKAQSVLVGQAKALLHPARQIIRIGTSPVLNSSLLGPMLEPFKRTNSDIDVVLREMNMADLYRMLDEGLLDFVFGVADVHKKRWEKTYLYDEPLLFIPSGATKVPGARSGMVSLNDIGDEIFVMVPDACGLARSTRALFQSRRHKLKEYSGEALSYQVLEDWAALGVGAAILPESKVSRADRPAYTIRHKNGKEARITFEAIWRPDKSRRPHLVAFDKHLRQVVPSVIKGMVPQPSKKA